MVILLIYAGLRFLRDKQWGTADVGSSPVSVPLNIAYTTTYNGVCVDNGNYPTQNAIWSFTKKSLTAFTVSAYWPIDKKFLSGIVHWLTIGKQYFLHINIL